MRFGSESDVKAAVRRHKSFIGNKVFLHRAAAGPSKNSARTDAPSDGSHVAAREARATAARREGGGGGGDGKPAPVVAEVCETGRLFLRNLPYACAEADLEALLAPFGALVELHLPVARLEGERAPQGLRVRHVPLRRERRARARRTRRLRVYGLLAARFSHVHILSSHVLEMRIACQPDYCRVDFSM